MTTKQLVQTKKMKKSPIYLALTSVVFSSAALAAPTPTDDMENIVVTANRTQQDKFLSLSATEVISQQDIEFIQPQNITDLLETIAGISVVSQGGAGQASSVFMRGTNSDHTLVLVDGVRVGSATLGTTNFAAMSIGLIERIEIVKGPRAALWGSDAIGGVIQIFTKQLTSGEGYVSAGTGSHGFWKTEGAVGLGNEQHSLTLSASMEESDGFTANTYEDDDDGYDRRSVGLVGKSQVSEELSFQLVSRYEEGGSEYDPKWGGANEQDYENYSIKVGSQYQVENFFTEVSLSTSQDEGANFISGQKDDAAFIATERDQFSLVSQYSFSDASSLTAGFDWYDEQVSGNNSSWDKDERITRAAFVQARHQMAQFLFEGAVRRDEVSGLSGENTYNVSFGYQVDENLLVSLNRGTGFKAPTFNDLYWPGQGNPDLLPESIESTEFLVKNQFENGAFEFAVYNSDVENLIAWAPDASGNWKPANIAKAGIEGAEATLRVDIDDFSQKVALAYTRTEDKQTGEQLHRRPKVTANYTASYQWQDLKANGALNYRGSSLDSSGATLEKYITLDVSVDYQATENLLVIAKINNLFDKEYETATNYTADGTNFQLTGTYTF
ncbi:TonB-dependent receptor domain-containing protein [Thalassotalea sp. PLHSN55]|uniref:TonB-dependent receptor domain-containing protein n=1 Tax=Thalassotalea sp. PLHSN55 TaxID=3435888 RepID=UPI003F865762